MVGFLKNDLVQFLSLGFVMGAAALFFAQPQEARAEILQDLALDSAAAQLVSVADIANKG